MSPGRVLIWAQHLLGTGHFHRSLVIAEALARRDVAVTLVAGGPGVPLDAPRGVEIETLPAISARDGTSFELVEADGRPVDEPLWRARSKALEVLVDTRRPGLLLTEMFPFGRRAFRHEVRALIASVHASAPRAPIVCSVRDILVGKREAERYERMLALFNEHYDHLLVHGDERLLPFAATFPRAADLAARPIQTGFVTRAISGSTSAARSGVVVSAGGGAVGTALIEAAIAARKRSSLVDRAWTFIAGNRVDPGQLAIWRREIDGRDELLSFVRDLPARIAGAELSISQAGYNTVIETLSVGTPSVLVPYETASEDEQLKRAAAVTRLGRASVLREADLSPQALADAADEAVRLGPAAVDLAFDGAERSADLLVQWLHEAAHG